MRDGRVNTRPLVLSLLALAMTAACAGPNTFPTETAAGVAAAGGTLQGRLVTVGGPYPGSAKPLAGTVTITGDGGVARDLRVGPDGVYSISLPVGLYTVLGHSPDVSSDGVAVPCPGQQKAQVNQGASAVVDAICSIR